MHTTENTEPKKHWLLDYVRPKAALVALGVFGAAGAYYFLLADYHARLVLEHYLSRIHGTAVDVGSVRLSATKGVLEATNIQVAHPSIPEKNLYQIQSLTSRFQLAPLIRKQLVFDRVELNGIRYMSPRNPADPSLNLLPFEKSIPVFERFSSNLFSTLSSDMAKNPLKHLAQLSTGLHTKELIEERFLHLESAITIDQVQRELAKAEHEVETVINSPTSAELSQLLEAKELINKTQVSLRSKLHSLDKAIEKDVIDIRTHLGLPESDSGSFAPIIFGPKALGFLEQTGQWVEFSRRKMPLRSGPVGKSYLLQERRRGTGVHFPYLAGTPTLAVQSLVIHSTADASTGAGFVEGEITGLTTDPYILGKPAKGSLKLSFPAQGLEQVSMNFEIDHVGETPKEHIEIEIGSLALKNSSICKITDLSLKILQGEGSLKVSADFEQSKLKAAGEFKSKGTTFEITSPYKKIEEYVQSLLIPFYQFELTAAVEGPLDDLKLTLNSSLDSKLTNGLNEEIQRQLSAVDETIKGNLMNQLMPRKHNFLDRLNKMKTVDLENVLNQIEKSSRGGTRFKRTSQNEHPAELYEPQ